MGSQDGIRRISAAALVAVVAVGVSVGSASAFTVSDTSSSGGTSATVTSPSGATATVGGITRLTTPAVDPAGVESATPQVVGAADAIFTPGENRVQVAGYSGTSFPTWADVEAVVPTNDGLFHDWMEYTVTFDHPVVDPVLTISSVAGSSLVDPGIYEGWAAVRTGIPSVTTSAGATVTPALTLENFTPGFTVAAGNVIQAPTGTLPLELASRTAATAPNHALAQRLLDAAIPGTTLQSRTRGAGEVRIDAGGAPVTSVHLVAQLTALNLPTADNAGIVVIAMPQVAVRWPTEVSGSTTPASYGAATHTLTALRLGTLSQEAYATTQLTAPAAGTAADNSDGGYDAATPAALSSFESSFSVLSRGQAISLTVPLSNVTQAASVRGWIDFDGDGAFGSGEDSTLTSVAPGGTQATLTWTVPDDVAAGSTWLRLRAGFDGGQIADPTGWADSGEVEDYPMTIRLAQPTGGLAVDKTVTGVDKAAGNTAAKAQAGDVIHYGIAVRNDSPYAMADVTLTDALVGDLTCAGADGAALTLPTALAAGASFDCTGSHVVTAAEQRAGIVRNVATATGQWDDPDIEPGPVDPASGTAETATVGTPTPAANTAPGDSTASQSGPLALTGADAFRALIAAGVVIVLGVLVTGGAWLVRRRTS